MPDVCREWHNRAITFLYWKNYCFFHLCHSFSFSFPRDLETCQSAWLKLICHCLMTLNRKEHLQVLFCQSETFGPALGLDSCIHWWGRYVMCGMRKKTSCAFQESPPVKDLKLGESFTVGVLTVQCIFPVYQIP